MVIDTSAPKGRRWRDFSFNFPHLREQLALHRKARGQQDVDMEPVDPSKIPTLPDLIERGEIKRRKMIFDLKMRLLEFGTFFLLTLCLLICFKYGRREILAF